jgi:hypothetical protein
MGETGAFRIEVGEKGIVFAVVNDEWAGFVLVTQRRSRRRGDGLKC